MRWIQSSRENFDETHLCGFSRRRNTVGCAKHEWKRERRRLYEIPLQFTAHIGVYHQNAYRHRLYTEKRPFALLPPSRRLFLISVTAGNFFAHTLPPPLSPPSRVFRAFVCIYILYIYIHRILSCTVQLLRTTYKKQATLLNVIIQNAYM